jgi:hypothetical protein
MHMSFTVPQVSAWVAGLSTLVGTVAGWLTWRPAEIWVIWRRIRPLIPLVISLFKSLLKGATPMDTQTQQIVNALTNLKPIATTAVILVEEFLTGADNATKRSQAIMLLRVALTAGEQLAHIPDALIAFTTSDAVLGLIVDAVVKEANALGLFTAPVLVPVI